AVLSSAKMFLFAMVILYQHYVDNGDYHYYDDISSSASGTDGGGRGTPGDITASVRRKTSSRAALSSAFQPRTPACWEHSRAESIFWSTGTLNCFALSSTSRPSRVDRRTLLKRTYTGTSLRRERTNRAASSASHTSNGEGVATITTRSAF